MVIRKRNVAYAVAAMCFSASTAAAQQVLVPDQPVQGSVDRGAAACLYLPTSPGSQWRIDLTGSMITQLEVGRGSCESFTVDRANNCVGLLVVQFNSRVDFTAGGGAYVVRAQGYGGGGGNYTLVARQRPGVVTMGRLPPGRPITPWLAPGWTPPSVSSASRNADEGLAVGNVFKDCEDVCPEMVVIGRGAFTMGSPITEVGRLSSEGPRHPVAFNAGFAIGRYEITFQEWDACVAEAACLHRPDDKGWGRGRRPVFDVSWNDAMEYAAWLSDKTGQNYTLPSEAEWEYSARAGSDTPWHTGGAILTDDANILNAYGKTVTVGSYPPNAFGLHDVHGNVGEWTLDCLDTGYLGAPNDGSAATAGDCTQNRVSRGGSFSREPIVARSASRLAGDQTRRYGGIGFRVARAL